MNATSPTTLPNLTFVLGGTKSGKSAFAEQLVSRHGGNILYIATADASLNDASMERRIRLHRKRRPSSWSTLETPLHPAQDAENLLRFQPADSVLLDCVTLWVTNMLFSRGEQEITPGEFESLIRQEIHDLLRLISHSTAQWTIVSGETGLGGTHATPLERQFCDGLGLANQLISQAAGKAYLVVASRPIPLPPPF
ncbi:bifunctional adenosylcobinamide kinase/adenosylcobinamide-phosphate guanylyltransferase [Akkermansia sp. N21169]|jgi:adenosylcobinamide kinase/adenosylcobinamide-phosphate guanylyltransferase|uniref:bifunctional adenosylcobinamide kinase/adenosylcobinamide-phosphate guanylyltransferase n=1 Tax=unclassified Akkermansia TaxID=2608915 RepID=UPI00244E7022|nr:MULTISPECIES: bifunctional adenosylcobinamide kinase/adenosylcobinamide-phosphate guanylyltransferase [unclassified Akkermansia]MDH3068404.1 bifunctional adenosylcobinamide kinase/adenosylcobinamide-phosphate guanylyltransferase [Akkermansia sp. N21169]WPX39826.1 bifunctional adenosylcobinamide kinase/adenosylcobinamide-phosphate guanylyltransferase [Akkermansia sp. N21116]